jgi:hypothetical protein
MPGKIEGRASNFAQVDSKTCGSGKANSIHVPRSASGYFVFGGKCSSDSSSRLTYALRLKKNHRGFQQIERVGPSSLFVSATYELVLCSYSLS